jgi:TolB-like protein/Tfp pilus assembly protein PilF
MTSRATTPAASKDTEEKLRQQLNRILASKTFQPVERLKRFLGFVVEEELAGRGEQLKEFLVGIEVFGKEASFDPRNDPIVRVQARRLRARLARYYREEGQSDEILIELPKGGYAPAFKHLHGATQKRSVTAALASRNTILVLPFSDDSAGGDQDYFCRGLSQEIVHAVAKVPGIRVVAPERSDQFDDHGDPREAANRLNAAMVIGGSIRKFGDIRRIMAHLIDAASGCYLWSESFDRKAEDTFAMQEEIAQVIREKLQVGLVDSGHAKHGRRPTENLAAYNLYLQGRHLLNQRTEEGLRRAVDLFEKAIAEDPHYANAYSGLTDSYGLLAHYGVLAPAEVWTKTASNAAWAVLLDENSAEAHTSLAHVKSTQDWDWIGADREFQRAISLNPQYPTAHHWYGMSCLAPLGRLDEALDQMLIANALDPVSSIIARDTAVIHYYKRDLETALEQCDHTIEQHPHFSAAYWILGLVQEQIGDLDEAVAALQRAIQLSPQSPRMQGALSRVLAISGKHAEARRILDQLYELAGKRYVSPFELASIHLALGEKDEGFKWLEKAVQDRCFELISIKVDPRFDAFKNDPRFISVFSHLGLH